jgi:uncharacterized protein YutE (UPF0331/DUF86 family)
MDSGERIKEHVKHLQFRVDRLRELQGTTLHQYATDFDKRDLIEHNFRVAIESCSDIALLVAARLKLREPQHRRDVYNTLAQANRLPKDLASKLADLTSLRNLLVHRYLAVEPTKMLKHLQEDLTVFDNFTSIAIGWSDEFDSDSKEEGSEN